MNAHHILVTGSEGVVYGFGVFLQYCGHIGVGVGVDANQKYVSMSRKPNWLYSIVSGNIPKMFQEKYSFI